MKKTLNITLFLSFIVTIMAPITGIYIHKLAAAVFLLLSIIHIITYRKKIKGKQWLLLVLILFSFVSGLFSMILEQYPVILHVHHMSSIVLVFFLTIHIFVFHKKMIFHSSYKQ